MNTQILLLIMIALSTGAISFTITTTSIFIWLRELVSLIHKKLEELIHCPWCLGHYISLAMIIIFRNEIIFLPINFWLHLIINWFSVMCISGLLHYVLLRTYEPVAKAMFNREIMKLKNQK